MKVCIIGAGAAGCSAARLLADAGSPVDLFERESEVGGNCLDEFDGHGVLIHRYGPHYFRAADLNLVRWLSGFTEWLPGRYYVRAQVGLRLVPLPVSLATMAALKGRAFSPEDFEEYLRQQRVPVASPRNAEEQCLARFGRELYEMLFEGYTRKQWGCAPREMDASVTARIPLRMDWDEHYVTEPYQLMPLAGYTAMFKGMVDSPLIELHLGHACGGEEVAKMRPLYDAVIFTGAADELFGHRFGPLGYRSARFEFRHFPESYVQPCVQINYPSPDVEYTRTVEIKHVTGQKVAGTTVATEYPAAEGRPLYPLLTEAEKTRYARYAELAAAEAAGAHPLFLVGRLAEFRYYNMDQVFLRVFDLLEQLGVRAS